MRKSSREEVFINTAPPEERVGLLKPINDMKQMEDDCEEIFTSSLLKKCTQRPQRLEHATLAAWYNISYKPYVKKTLF